MGVQGFPTLKIIRPGKKVGRPTVEDYQGARSAKAIVDAVVEKMPNHVRKVTDKTLGEFEAEKGARAVLFTEKGTTSALIKALATDFLGSVSVAQVRNKESAIVDKFGITTFPTFAVIPAGATEPVLFKGDLKKDALSKFITETTGVSPNPDPAPEGAKKSKTPKADKKAKKKFEQSSASHKSAESASEKLKATSIELDEEPTASPDPQVDAAKPVKLAEAVPALDVLSTGDDLHAKCLNPSAKICILALLPQEEAGQQLTPDSAAQAVLSLSEVRHKLSGRGLFPFYAVAAANPLAAELRAALDLKGEEKIEILATNAKRSWVRRYKLDTFGVGELGEWVDAIKMNEGAKDKLPESLVKEVEVEAEEVKQEEPAVKVEEIKVEVPVQKEKEEPKIHVVQDGDVMIEIEELDDDVDVNDLPPRDEL
jgi:protein disulfide-isomerase A6